MITDDYKLLTQEKLKSQKRKNKMASCSACGQDCVSRISQTEKNPGRAFWACPDKCKVWNGWIDDEQQPISLPSSKLTSAAPPPPFKIGGKKKAKQPISKEIYKCRRCEKVLDLEHEVNSNVSRYGAMGYGLRNEIQKEIYQAFKDEEYTCEKCLGNE